MEIILNVTETEYKNYNEYCNLFETNIIDDLTEYLKVRGSEMVEYKKKLNKN